MTNERNTSAITIIKPHPLAVELGMSTTTLWRLSKLSPQNGFPSAVYIGKKILGWRAQAIEEWLKKNEIKGDK
jgi:predicted DNA-binding transcriptional regulator AlpA